MTRKRPANKKQRWLQKQIEAIPVDASERFKEGMCKVFNGAWFHCNLKSYAEAYKHTYGNDTSDFGDGAKTALNLILGHFSRKALPETVQAAMDNIVRKIIDPEFTAQWLKKAVVMVDADAPIKSWSSQNQMLCYFMEAFDCRGKKQWEEVGRTLKEDAKACHILVPSVKKEDDKGDNEVETDENKIRFVSIPVYDVSQTVGEPLPYQRRLEAININDLPLIQIAKAMGVAIDKAVSDGRAAGYYEISKREIILHTDNEGTFLHELSHAVYYHLGGKKETAMPFQEVIAELSGCLLSSLYGKNPVDLPHTKAYITDYSKKAKKHVAYMIGEAMQWVIKIFRFIRKFEAPLVSNHAFPKAA
jgi:hypothetical protein